MKNQTNSNGRGGKRAGAGRKAGSVTKRTQAIVAGALAEGITPLEFMLAVMRNDSTHEDPRIQAQREGMRFEAAKAAAPYIHPRLQAIEHTGAGGGDISHSIKVVFGRD
ncbi:MAG: hypothetical protein V4792_09785 [Pseudomonadota bacterium]